MTEELRRRTRLTNLPGSREYETKATDFIGTLVKVEETYVQQFDRDRISLNFEDNDVIAQTGPVDAGNIKVEFMFGGQGGKFGVFADSVVALKPELKDVDTTREDQNQWGLLEGLRMHLKKVEKPLRVRDVTTNQWSEAATLCWIAVEIIDPLKVPAPASILSPSDQALALLNGRTEDAWIGIAVRDTTVMKDVGLVKKIIHKEFVTEAIAAGKLKLNADKTYTVLEGVRA